MTNLALSHPEDFNLGFLIKGVTTPRRYLPAVVHRVAVTVLAKLPLVCTQAYQSKVKAHSESSPSCQIIISRRRCGVNRQQASQYVHQCAFMSCNKAPKISGWTEFPRQFENRGLHQMTTGNLDYQYLILAVACHLSPCGKVSVAVTVGSISTHCAALSILILPLGVNKLLVLQ